MTPEMPLGLTWGENRNREPRQIHVEWHASCGCAFHPKPFPHVHPCGDAHKRPDLNIVAAAPAAPSPAEPEYVEIDGERRVVIPCPDGKPGCEVLHTAALRTSVGEESK